MRSSKFTTALLSFLFIALSVQASSGGCFSEFQEEFDAATAEYQANTAYCDSVIMNPGFCQAEAEAIYDQRLENASNALYDCVGYTP